MNVNADGQVQSPEPDAVPDSGSPSESTRGSLLWLVLAVAASIVVIDQLTKAWAVARLKGQSPIEVVGTWLQFTYGENTGAAFGIGTGFTWIFTAIAIVVAIVIIRTARRLGSAWWAVALGGLLGGAVGNLVDRLTRPPGPGQGYVVDFIALPNFPVFNVADMAITVSAGLMIWLTLRGVDLSGGKPSGGAGGG